MSSEVRKKSKALSYEEMGSFFENMGMMVRAGITAGEAVELLKDDVREEMGEGALADVYAGMAESMQSSVTINVYATPGMDVKALAKEVRNELISTENRRRLAWQ